MSNKKIEPAEEKKDIWNPQYDEMYYTISPYGKCDALFFEDSRMSNSLKEVANCCTDENIMKKRALQETLSRLLWRFNLQNGGDEKAEEHWNIYFNSSKKSFDIISNQYNMSSINFISKEIAQMAIDEIIKPFIEKYPELNY